MASRCGVTRSGGGPDGHWRGAEGEGRPVPPVRVAADNDRAGPGRVPGPGEEEEGRDDGNARYAVYAERRVGGYLGQHGHRVPGDDSVDGVRVDGHDLGAGQLEELAVERRGGDELAGRSADDDGHRHG